MLHILPQDHKPCIWFSDDGTRLGTFDGHNGTVWTCDIDCTLWELSSLSMPTTSYTGDSTRLLTGSGDSSVRLWDVQTGTTLHTWKTHEPCRAVKFALGDRLAAFSTDPFMAAQSAINFTRIAEDARCV